MVEHQFDAESLNCIRSLFGMRCSIFQLILKQTHLMLRYNNSLAELFECLFTKSDVFQQSDSSLQKTDSFTASLYFE